MPVATVERVMSKYPGVICFETFNSGGLINGDQDATATQFYELIDKRLDGDPAITAAQITARSQGRTARNPNGDAVPQIGFYRTEGQMTAAYG